MFPFQDSITKTCFVVVSLWSHHGCLLHYTDLSRLFAQMSSEKEEFYFSCKVNTKFPTNL